MSEEQIGLQEDPQVEEAEVLELKEDSPEAVATVEGGEVEQEALNFTKWDFGHLTFKCSRCGCNEILQEDVEDGLMFTIPTTDKHNLILECPQCKTTLTLYWQKSEKEKPKPVIKEDETVQEESKKE